MIRLMLSNYTDKDVENLRHIFTTTVSDLQLAFSCDHDCENCEAETPCMDLRSCIRYLENVRKHKRG